MVHTVNENDGLSMSNVNVKTMMTMLEAGIIETCICDNTTKLSFPLISENPPDVTKTHFI